MQIIRSMGVQFDRLKQSGGSGLKIGPDHADGLLDIQLAG